MVGKMQPLPPMEAKKKPGVIPTPRMDKVQQRIARAKKPANGEFDEDAPGEPRPGFKIPKTLAECADLAYKTKLERYAKQKEVKSLRAEQTALEEHLINNLPKSQAEGVRGRAAQATIVRKSKPRVADWLKFCGWVAKNKAWEVLQRRINEKAVNERLEAKKKVDGVEIYNAVTVSLTKA